MLRKVLTLAARIVYRKHADNEVCCCGSDFAGHGWNDGHTARCAKEYAITCWVNHCHAIILYNLIIIRDVLHCRTGAY